jgi:hypothetical protein
MKRTAAQRRKDKARNKIRRQHYVVHGTPPRGRTKYMAIIDDAVHFDPSTFLKTSGLIPSATGKIPLHKSLDEYFEDMDKEMARLPECDRTKENEAVFLANIIREGLGLPPVPLHRENPGG